MTSKSDSTMNAAHSAWNEANQKVRAHERLLSSALELYKQGQGPLPLDMLKEIQALRADCNTKFKAMMAAISDSTTGPT